MKNFTDATLRQIIIKELEAAAQVIAEKHGLAVERGHGTYTLGTLSLPVKFTVKEIKAAQTASLAGLLGLPENIIGHQFKHKTKTFTVTGLNPNAPKFSIELKDQNGKGFKCSVEQLRELGGVK